jgi:hypothetical protein
MYRFCVNNKKGRQERNGKILLLLCEAEVRKCCNLCRKIGAVSIFTILDEGLNLFTIITVAFKETMI